MPATLPPRDRDPIRDAPLRDPGQSLREQIDDHFYDVFAPWISVVVLVFIMAVMEWVRWSLNAPYAPLPVSLCAVVVTIIAAWRIRRVLGLRRQQTLGLKGERSVGQYLQAMLMPQGYTVIHDICIDDFNVDHAVIGPGGVFAVEVKTRSKPVRGDARVTYDGERVLVNGVAPDRDPVIQARAGANNIEQILERNTGRKITVRSIVLFPNWYVERQPPGVETWVLNEKAFVGFLEREPEHFSPEDTRVLAEGLARYVRDQFDR
jgi:Nuclease-related domain